MTAVGYLNSEVCPKDGYCAVVPTFDKVDGSVLTLNDITPVKGGTKEITKALFALQLLDESGETAPISKEALEGLIPADKIDAFIEDNDGASLNFCYDEGTWYLKCDTDMDYPMNAFKIPLGTGLLMSTTSKMTGGAKLLFSGVVVPEETESPLCGKDEYRFTGNIAPADMKLGEFYPIPGGTKAITKALFSLQFLDNSGETAPISVEALTGVIPADKIEKFVEDNDGASMNFCYDEGTWYLKCDSNGEYPMNNLVIKAGQGLLLSTTSKMTGGAKLVIPSAL